MTLDVRDVEAVRELVEQAVRETGRLDVMVNNAGVSFPAPIVDGDPEEWRTMLETNVLALLVGSQAAVRAMRACKAEGHIVNISSIAAQRPDSGVYGSTKHAVNCISATLRRELEDDTIRVVNVMPGAIATNFARNFDPKFVAGIAKAAGANVEIAKGERLPDEVFRGARRADEADARRARGRGGGGALRGDAADPRQRARHRGPPAEAAPALTEPGAGRRARAGPVV